MARVAKYIHPNNQEIQKKDQALEQKAQQTEELQNNLNEIEGKHTLLTQEHHAVQKKQENTLSLLAAEEKAKEQALEKLERAKEDNKN